MSSTLKQALEATRDGYVEEGCWLRFLLESFLGCGGFQGRVKQPPAGWWGAAAGAYSSFPTTRLHGVTQAESGSYLDRHHREDIEKFCRRMQVAHYPNYVRPTTQLKVSYIVRKPHKRLNVPKELKAWIERTGYDNDFRLRALRAAVFGWWPMLVDMPSTDGARNAAEAGNVDPYTIAMTPCDLLDYGLDEKGAFVWAKTRSTFVRRPSFQASMAVVRRYTCWTRTSFEIWETEEVQGNEGDPVSKGSGNHPFNAVPIVSWRAEMSVEDKVKADSINADIAVEARRLFNLVSEFDEHIRGQAFALLIWPGDRPESGASEAGTENGLVIGAEQKNLPHYIAPPASIAETFEKRIEASIIEIYRMARVEYDRASGTKSSAQSKEQNFEQTNLAIVDFAAALAVADRDTLILVGRGLGIAEEKLQAIECIPHESYASEALNDEIDSVTSALTLDMGGLFKSELLKRLATRLLPGLGAETRQRIDAEIDERTTQAEHDAALMRNDAPFADTDDEDEAA